MKSLFRCLSRVADSSQQHHHPLVLRRRQEKPRRNHRPGVPEGHIPLCVGHEMERFVIRAELLGRPAFVELLRQSAREYGYEQRGVLRIPCPVPVFERVLDALEAEEEEGIVVAAGFLPERSEIPISSWGRG